MKQNTLLAFVLIGLGIAAFAYQGISYTTREKAVDLGGLQVTTQKTNTFPLSPVFGAIALTGGILILLRSSRPAVV